MNEEELDAVLQEYETCEAPKRSFPHAKDTARPLGEALGWKRNDLNRVMIWDTTRQRKFSGTAAPAAANLTEYLHNHPDREVYNGQDSRLQLAAEGPGTPRVTLWDTKRKRQIKLSAASVERHLDSNPHCEVYNGQDTGGKRKLLGRSQASAHASKFHASGLTRVAPQREMSTTDVDVDIVADIQIVSEVAPDDTTASAGEQWVQCDICDKWRRLTFGTAPDAGQEWACSFNPDVNYNLCEIPEEKVADGVADASPKGLCFKDFQTKLWPKLEQCGWRVELGDNPADRFYCLPGVDHATGQLQVDFFNSALEVCKHCTAHPDIAVRELVRYIQPAVDSRIDVYWPSMDMWYHGVVIAYDLADRTHSVVYEDNETHWHDLGQMQWRDAKVVPLKVKQSQTKQVNIKWKRNDLNRVMIWDTTRQRKLSGTAAPAAANLTEYLHNHPDREVYNGQDALNVTMWDTKKKRKFNVSADNTKSSSAKHCEVYNGQDNRSKRNVGVERKNAAQNAGHRKPSWKGKRKRDGWTWEDIPNKCPTCTSGPGFCRDRGKADHLADSSELTAFDFAHCATDTAGIEIPTAAGTPAALQAALLKCNEPSAPFESATSGPVGVQGVACGSFAPCPHCTNATSVPVKCNGHDGIFMLHTRFVKTQACLPTTHTFTEVSPSAFEILAGSTTRNWQKSLTVVSAVTDARTGPVPLGKWLDMLPADRCKSLHNNPLNPGEEAALASGAKRHGARKTHLPLSWTQNDQQATKYHAVDAAIAESRVRVRRGKTPDIDNKTSKADMGGQALREFPSWNVKQACDGWTWEGGQDECTTCKEGPGFCKYRGQPSHLPDGTILADDLDSSTPLNENTEFQPQSVLQPAPAAMRHEPPCTSCISATVVSVMCNGLQSQFSFVNKRVLYKGHDISPAAFEVLAGCTDRNWQQTFTVVRRDNAPGAEPIKLGKWLDMSAAQRCESLHDANMEAAARIQCTGNHAAAARAQMMLKRQWSAEVTDYLKCLF